MGLLEKPSGEKQRHLLWSFQAGFPISNRERQLLLSAYSLSGTVTPGDGLIRLPQQGCVWQALLHFIPWLKKLGLEEVRSLVLKPPAQLRATASHFPITIVPNLHTVKADGPKPLTSHAYEP